MRHRREHPTRPPMGRWRARSASSDVGPSKRSERAREARRRSEAAVEWVTEEVSAAPTTEQDSDRAKRGWKRSSVPPPLMLFHSFAPVSSFSEKTASNLLLDRGKGLVPHPQVPGRNPLDPEGGQVPGVPLFPGKSGVDWYRCFEPLGTQVPVVERSEERERSRPVPAPTPTPAGGRLGTQVAQAAAALRPPVTARPTIDWVDEGEPAGHRLPEHRDTVAYFLRIIHHDFSATRTYLSDTAVDTAQKPHRSPNRCSLRGASLPQSAHIRLKSAE